MQVFSEVQARKVKGGSECFSPSQGFMIDSVEAVLTRAGELVLVRGKQ